MKTKTQTIASILSVALLSMQFIACKKESVTTSSTRVNSEELSSQIAAKANLVAWYKFTNGSTIDYSGNNNHLSPHGVTLATDFMGRPNNAYYFNGTNSFMVASNSPTLNPAQITLAALFKPMGLYGGEGETSRI